LNLKKGGLRTAIGVCPVRVWVKRGAETTRTRLRKVSFLSPARHTQSPPSPDLPTSSPPNRPPPPPPQKPRPQPRHPAPPLHQPHLPPNHLLPFLVLDGLGALFNPFSPFLPFSAPLSVSLKPSRPSPFSSLSTPALSLFRRARWIVCPFLGVFLPFRGCCVG